ncbi:MAG: AzlD domain-containing protein [Oculatellaceae cyanobacterium Prado106]|jgi:branched-subunit amino acid transport protein|nr:AzlD domain-containing protein [Oculatellaceae cyanobacterium Prado106]
MNGTMNEVLLIAGMALVTIAIRYPMLAISGRIRLSERFLQLLRYVPPAVLTAILVPAVLMPNEGVLAVSYTNARLVGAIAAILVGVWRKNLLLTIVTGMFAFFAWQAVLSVLPHSG